MQLTRDIPLNSQEQGEHLKNLPRSRSKLNFLIVEIDSSLIYKMLTVLIRYLNLQKLVTKLYCVIL